MVTILSTAEVPAFILQTRDESLTHNPEEAAEGLDPAFLKTETLTEPK